MRGDIDSLYPLDTLVEGAVRNHDTNRGTMRRRQLLTKEAMGKEHVLFLGIAYGNVASVISGFH